MFVCVCVCVCFVCVCVCFVCVCVCVCVCVLISSYNLPTVIPGYLAMAMLEVRRGTIRVASQFLPCTLLGVQKPSTSKTSKTQKVKFTFKNKSSILYYDSYGFSM